MVPDNLNVNELLKRLDEINNRITRRDNIYLNKLTELTAFMLTCPMPSWVKGLNGRMMFCNHAYEQEYGISPTIYNDKLDTSFWTKKEASSFRKHDLEVEETRCSKRFKEKIFNRKKSTYQELEVIKWPVTVGGSLLGIAGQVLHARDIKLREIKQ